MREMSSNVRTVLILFVSVCSLASGQGPDDLGTGGCSAIASLPTCSVVPSAGFRIQSADVFYANLRNGHTPGIGFSVGLSSHMELFSQSVVRHFNSDDQYAPLIVGGKFVLPFRIPGTDNAALWLESISSAPESADMPMYRYTVRGGLIAEHEAMGMPFTLLLGAARNRESVNPLLGLGCTYTIVNALKFGAETVFGDLEKNGISNNVSLSMILIPNLALKGVVGYTAGRNYSGLTGGLGITTSATDLHFIAAEKPAEQPAVPSFDEVEQSLHNQTPTETNDTPK